jgi:fructose-bisphosphate aldolase class II
MPLVSMVDAAREASRRRGAVPLFVCIDVPVTEGVIRGCEAAGGPAILGFWSGLLARSGGPEFAAWIRRLAEESPASLSLMLDHGRTVEECRQAVSLGFTDVMYDGSALPFEENLANTRRVAEFARAAGAGVEAELGIVGSGADYASFGARGQGLTDVAEAERFAAEGACDVLAVAIGTAHGHYNAPPRLDLARLRDIRGRTEVPLAVHGGSGLSDDEFGAVIAGGASKINVGTDLMAAAGEAIARQVRTEGPGYFPCIRAARAGVQERVEHYLRLFRTERPPPDD